MKHVSGTDPSASATESRPQDRITLLRVSLACRAAPGLGCGSRAKPLLLELARRPAVSEAWLNRSGTAVAIVWKDRAARDQVVPSLRETHGLHVQELKGKDRQKGLEDFLSGARWYRDIEVDSLSDEEAKIIAARLVRRLQERLSLSDGKVKRLQSAFTQVCRHELVHHPAKPERARRDRIARNILDTGRRHLDERGVAILRNVVAAGHRPLRNEK